MKSNHFKIYYEYRKAIKKLQHSEFFVTSWCFGNLEPEYDAIQLWLNLKWYERYYVIIMHKIFVIYLFSSAFIIGLFTDIEIDRTDSINDDSRGDNDTRE